MEIYGLVFLLLVSNATLVSCYDPEHIIEHEAILCLNDTKFVFNLIHQLWASLIEHLVDKSLDRSILKEVEAFRKMEEELTTRNIYSWEAEFDRQLEQFQRDYEGMKCTQRPILQKALQSMDDQINRVKSTKESANSLSV